MNRHCLLCIILFAFAVILIPAARADIAPPTPEWKAKIKELAPAKPTVEADKRKTLVFSLFTGYDHKVIPHVDAIFEILGEKSGAFDVVFSKDIESFAPDKLAGYDVLVLNNNCSKGSRRNLFLDELEQNERYAGLNAAEREAKAKALERSLLEFIAGGRGLVAIHGAPTMLNNSKEFTELIGAAFDYHPPAQEVTLRPVEPDHPVLAAFRGKGPFVHKDEPYMFGGPYEKFNFRPLLVMDADKLKDKQGQAAKMVRYVSWIKPHGLGRVFFCSPSHFPESYESAALLRFLLDGLQYAAGDLKCDDTPRK